MNEKETNGYAYHNEVTIITLLDEMRTKRGLSIEQFTDKIVSRRNYSRYLNGELKIKYSILIKLLEKIDMNIVNFSFLIQNSIILKYGYEITFFDYIVSEKFEEAEEIYNSQIKDNTFYTLLSETAIPSAIIYFKYIQKELNLNRARIKIRELIDFNKLISKQMYSDDDISALYIYSMIASDADKKKIKEWLIDVNIYKKHKNYFLQSEKCRYLKHIMLLRTLTEPETFTEEDTNLIDLSISKVLDHDRRARLNGFNLIIFKILYQYAHKTNHKKIDIYAFYYLSIILSFDEDKLPLRPHNVIKKDYESFLEHLTDEKYISMGMYEELINDEHL